MACPYWYDADACSSTGLTPQRVRGGYPSLGFRVVEEGYDWYVSFIRNVQARAEMDASSRASMSI